MGVLTMHALLIMMDRMIIPFLTFFHGRADMESLGLRVLACGCGDAEAYHGRRERRVVHRFILGLLASGEGELHSEFLGRRQVGKGCYWLLFPHEDFGYGAAGDDWRLYWCSFEGPAVVKLDQQGRFVQGRTLGKLSGSARPAVQGRFAQLLEYGRSGRIERERQMPGMLHLLLDMLFPTAFVGPSDPPVEALGRILQELRARPQRNWDFHELAADWAMSYSLLRLRFKQYVGLPPQQFLLRERVNQACGHLTSGASVKEAAHRVGIDDAYYFSRLFKKVTGVSPSDFARRRRNGREGPSVPRASK
jgi:AraC-like DNA-binding protein